MSVCLCGCVLLCVLAPTRPEKGWVGPRGTTVTGSCELMWMLGTACWSTVLPLTAESYIQPTQFLYEPATLNPRIMKPKCKHPSKQIL